VTTPIVVAGLFARGGPPGVLPALLKSVSFQWERGVLAVIGRPFDGTSALLGVLDGSVRPTSGRVAVLGRAPGESRAQVVHVSAAAELPDPLRVAEVVELSAELRSEPTGKVGERLGLLGLAHLADRPVKSLSPGERRAVALAIALSSRAPVLLLDEPLAALDPVAPSALVEAIRARAASAAVVVTTASVRDATRIGDQLALLTQGAFTHLPPSLAHAGPGGARVRVVVAEGVAAFTAALVAEPAVSNVDSAGFAASPREGGPPARVLVVSGSELLAVARAVASVATRTSARVESIESAVLPLDVIRAAAAMPTGVSRGTP